MTYNPLTKEEAHDMSQPKLIDEGKYQCELVEVHNTDRNGNTLLDRNGEKMTRIKLKVWDNDGRERFVYTNLFWGNNNKMAYRTRHFAESFRLVDLYEDRVLYDRLGDHLNNGGHCYIYIQNPKPKNDGTDAMWPAKNDVRDFVITATKTEFEDNDIPF